MLSKARMGLMEEVLKSMAFLLAVTQVFDITILVEYLLHKDSQHPKCRFLIHVIAIRSMLAMKFMP